MNTWFVWLVCHNLLHASDEKCLLIIITMFLELDDWVMVHWTAQALCMFLSQFLFVCNHYESTSSRVAVWLLTGNEFSFQSVINGFFASSIFEIPLRLKVILALVQLHAWNLIFDFLSMVTRLTLYASWYIFVSINISFTGVITLLNGINFKTLWISRRTP